MNTVKKALFNKIGVKVDSDTEDKNVVLQMATGLALGDREQIVSSKEELIFTTMLRGMNNIEEDRPATIAYGHIDTVTGKGWLMNRFNKFDIPEICAGRNNTSICMKLPLAKGAKELHINIDLSKTIGQSDDTTILFAFIVENDRCMPIQYCDEILETGTKIIETASLESIRYKQSCSDILVGCIKQSTASN